MRDLLKTGTYGTMHFVVAVAVAYAISGSWQIAIGIGLIEPAVQTIAYVVHERAWRSVPAKLSLSLFAGRQAAKPLRRQAA